MATVNTKATGVTNPDSTPSKANPLHIAGARMYSSVGTVEVAAADDNGSVYRFMRVHSSWSPRHVWIYNDAITSGATYEVGLHEIAENGGAAADADVFATAIAMTSARLDPVDMLFEALNIDKIEKRIWEHLGLSSDPGKWYDLTMTGTAVGSGAGTISICLEYVGPA